LFISDTDYNRTENIIKEINSSYKMIQLWKETLIQKASN
jgi:hypothetical protein